MYVCIQVGFFIYERIRDSFFVINGIISYDVYIQLIQSVSKNNYFMNYGLWSKDTLTMKEANENLVKFVFQKSIQTADPVKVLDVGCGYGEQDTLLIKALPSNSTVVAVDISEPQIFFANETYRQPNLTFEVANALNLDKTYANQRFDLIYSIESAFHYKERPKFFKACHTILNPAGLFVIADITLSDSYQDTLLSSVFLRLFSDFLSFPRENAISTSAWKKSLESEFEIVEYYNITEDTFLPYYRHFFKEFMKNKGLPSILGTSLYNMFELTQPFAYNVAICKPLNRS